MALKSIIRDVADTKMRAWKKQMASLPRHRQLEAERMQVFADADHGDGDASLPSYTLHDIMFFNIHTIYHI